MNQEILDRIKVEFIMLEGNRVKLNTAFKEIELQMPVSTPEKTALNEAYQAVIKNMGAIAQLIKEGL